MQRTDQKALFLCPENCKLPLFTLLYSKKSVSLRLIGGLYRSDNRFLFMLKQQLQQKLQQKLSPAQIQVIKMLEVPTLELEERIRQELEENPALEEGAEPENDTEDIDDDLKLDDGGNNEDIDLDEYMADDDIPDYKLKANNTSKDDKHEDIPFSAGMTFHEFLIDQVGLLQLSDKDRLLTEYVIGNIDEEGYLRRTPEAMVDDIVFQSGVQTTEEEIKRIIQIDRKSTRLNSSHAN